MKNIQTLIDDAKFSKFHWSLVLWCAVLIIFDGYDLVIYGSVRSSLTTEWGLTPLQAGGLASYALMGMMFGALVFGTVSNIIGYKKVIAICVVLFSSFTFLCGFADSPQTFSLFRFFAGLGIGGLMPTVVALTTEYSPKKMKTVLTTIMFSGYAVGGMLSALMGINLIPAFGWQSVFYVGIIPLLLLPVAYIKLPESMAFLIKKGRNEEAKTIAQKIKQTNAENIDFTIQTTKTNSVGFTELFKKGMAWNTLMFWIIFFMNLLANYGLNTWLPELMKKAGYGLGSNLTFLFVLNFGAIFGAIGGGLLGDKFDLKKVIAIFFTIAALSLALLSIKFDTVVLYLIIGITGATIVGTQILAYSYVAQRYPATYRSTGIGWASGIGRLGAIIGPILGGMLLKLELPFHQNFYICAIPATIAAIATFLVKNDRLKEKIVGAD
jgi:AAHS family benzoate transporter-like MFS transporter